MAVYMHMISGKEMDTVGSLGFYAQPSQRAPGSVGDPVSKKQSESHRGRHLMYLWLNIHQHL